MDIIFLRIWGMVVQMIVTNHELALRKPEVRFLFEKVYADYQARRKHDEHFGDCLGELEAATSLCTETANKVL